ncbi:VanZ like family protein [[Clostridium] aminophilum]|uniref:VanZ like family protein n=1 Tax=[Clostridium] aminophilum TaxID=1526 RepID=A0A1I0HMB7_9FIRM|nr:VanZ family protein [[Clostridium] aminophilum]SET84286.1 VanZ like family protein [[Clostridium] aminophilum]
MIKKRELHQRISWALFFAYLILLVYIMFFSDALGRGPHEDYSYNLVPLREIRRFYEYRKTLGFGAFFLNTYGNVICFLPFGFILPIITKIGESCFTTVLLSFMLSLSIETAQLAFKVGSFDVDDMILNLLGGLVGYIAVYTLKMLLGVRRRAVTRKEGCDNV